jgi:A/G-specific adenine glycosylase
VAAELARDLERWFQQHGRDLPWRRTADPYAILISEVMLQQTQIATVLDRGYYERWLTRFPDFTSLAAAPESEVLQAWEGLGYYRRARSLQALARAVIDQHNGTFPSNPDAIRALPGIGPYTAGAIASFAFNLPEPLVDGNVARVLARLDDLQQPVDSTAGRQHLWQRAEELVRAAASPRRLNSALMELGQAICRPGRPLCLQCPVKRHCSATAPAELPVKKPRPEITAVTEHVFFLMQGDAVLLEQERGPRRTGLWKLPPLPAALKKQPPVLLKSTYSITRYKVTLWVHAAPSEPALVDNQRLIPRAELGATPMPSPYRRALDTLLADDTFQLH